MGCGLFPFDARLFDDRPPLFDFGFLKCAWRLGRLLLARKYLLPKVGETPTHRGISKSFHDCAIQLRNQILRRALWRKKSANQADERAPRNFSSSDDSSLSQIAGVFATSFAAVIAIATRCLSSAEQSSPGSGSRPPRPCLKRRFRSFLDPS